MHASERRVVITGLGILSPIGRDPAEIRSALRERRSGVKRIHDFAVGDALPTEFGGEIADVDQKVAKSLCLPRIAKTFAKTAKYMARDIQLAVVAAQLAMADAGLADGGVAPARLGIDLGAGLISTELNELTAAAEVAHRDGRFDFDVYGREGLPKIQPIWLLRYLPNMLACHISILLDCQGPSNTITEAEAASNAAIGEATRIIARGRADVMIAGGGDSKIHPLSMIRMTQLGQLSKRRDDPAKACRPFDREHDGWVPGEGAGILILEEREHALKRGARILGEILGYGSGGDANPGGGVGPDGRGVEISMRAALRDAGLRPEDLGHINAHGAALPDWDGAEARGIRRVVGDAGTPVTALKGYLGNSVSGCGALETIVSLMAVNQGFIPDGLNCDDPDPEVDLNLVRGGPLESSSAVFLNTNFTRHGQAASLIIRGNPSN